MPQTQASRGSLVLDFGYGRLGKPAPLPSRIPDEGTFLAGVKGIEAWTAAYAFRYDAIGSLLTHVWVSLRIRRAAS